MATRTVPERFEALFGRHWQAALDRAEIVSRRRAREIGAGDDPSSAVLAMLELLEAAPGDSWPERWHGMGKRSDRCPCLAFFSDHLVNGKIAKSDVVLLWDMHTTESKTVYRHIAIGMLPKAFQDYPTSHPVRETWVAWNRQWDCAHGGATVRDWLSNTKTTPEGLLADWLYRGKIGLRTLDRNKEQLTRWIAGFDLKLVHQLLDEARRADDDDDGDDD